MEVSADLAQRVASELSLSVQSVQAVAELLGGGATVPFVARYRKERTGGLDEVAIRAVWERLGTLVQLEERRHVVLRRIREQGQLTEELESKILAAKTRSELEDLYLPFKPKRRTKASVARERGLEPLAELMLAQPEEVEPLQAAEEYVDTEKGVHDAVQALAGAQDIVVERIVEDPDVRAELRRRFLEEGVLVAAKAPGVEGRTKFEDYYDHRAPVAGIPSHRYLAIRRGEAEGVLTTTVQVDEEATIGWLERHLGIREAGPWADYLKQAVRTAFKKRLSPAMQTEVRIQSKMAADQDAVSVFARNLEHRLLAPPFGPRRVVGIDPGQRTGCKCVAVDGTGRFLGHVTIYLFSGQQKTAEAERTFLDFVRKHGPEAVAVGNGTGGRETLDFVRRVLQGNGLDQVIVVQENEAGASVYSASEIARQEFPDLDVSIRGAISIARRLQDPLAELVKIEPKSIGVGQYQHDVDQRLLERKLHEVVESCVNRVGVELNTASASLLQYVAGIGPTLASRIVAHRDEHGPFESRNDLLSVKGLGPKVYEQAAGFLRIRNGEHPLDASAVHPERYELVERMARDLGVQVVDLVGNEELVSRIEWRAYVDGDVGEPTLRDILEELVRPGRDPREEFAPVAFREDVREVSDLKEGMVLEGVVTNVTNFGAFVDVGVHRDGLVHVSELADRFVGDPHKVVKVGDRLKVRVLSVDLERNRISLTARLDRSRARSPGESKPSANRRNGRQGPKGRSGQRRESKGFTNRPFEDLLSKVGR